jgi:putative drug exporter of the RND superfamily
MISRSFRRHTGGQTVESPQPTLGCTRWTEEIAVFRRLGAWCHDRRKRVLCVWIVALVAGLGIANGVGDSYGQDFTLDGFESTDGFNLLEDEFPDGPNSPFYGTIVFEAEQGVEDPAVKGPMESFLDQVAQIDGVILVESPYAPGGERQISTEGAAPGTIAFANVYLPEDIEFADVPDIVDEMEELEPQVDGLDIKLGGYLFAEFDEPSSELFGLAFAVIILIAAFGSVLAMGLPVGVALFGIGIGSAIVIFVSHLMQVPDFAPFLGVMIGLGVGIDYALLIVTRYREQLHTGHTVRESIEIALDTAGRAVVFAGATVVISLLGMLLMGVGFVGGLGVTAAATVAVTVLASITLLPALLGFAGDRIERTRRRGLIAAGFVALALAAIGLEVPALAFVGFAGAVLAIVLGFFVPWLKTEIHHRPPRPRQQTIAYRWSREIQHRPWPFAVIATVVLVVLALPVLGLRLGFQDESNFEEGTDTKEAYDLLAEGFGKGFNGPLLVVAQLPSGGQLATLDPVTAALGADGDVASVSGPIPNDEAAPTAALWNVVPASGPQDEATTDLVKRLRDDVLPSVEQQVGTEVLVTGPVAGNVDFSELLGDRLPLFFGAVLALSFLLLMVVFRSLLVPLKAVIMNLLSIGAAYGIIVALFQKGWLSGITGIEPGPIEAWAPMMLFAVVFGLSMDYEVFLLSRVREGWLRTGDTRTAVADGLAATAKVITAAAAIMVVVFGSFLLEQDRVLKMVGVGLATAILLDATIVRMVLVPATMELLGDKNWWLPRWLDRILPKLDVEGHADAPGDDTDPRDRELVGAND